MIKSGWLLGALMGLTLLSSCIENDEIFDSFAQYEKEQDGIDAYLDANNINASIDTSEAKLRYVIHEQGDGDKPKLDDITLVSIKGSLLNGTEFLNEDSVYLSINSWLFGYYLLLPYLNEGGSMTMYLPSYYAFKQSTAYDGKVPENSTVILEVELKEALTAFDYEQQKIDHYLEENELVAETDTVKGLRYIITEEGEGDYPSANSTINVDYSGVILGSTDPFDSQSGRDFSLSGLIEGWKILMPYVQEGGSIKMFIPSKYGYGASGSGSIPGYSTLIFDVKLNTVK